MASLADIESALRAAHAAGDTENARRLAEAYSEERAATDPGVSAGRQFDPAIGSFGQVEPGTIDVKHLPVVHNPDGSVSTVRSMSFEDDSGLNVLVPTVVRGKIVSGNAAIDEYYKTGRHLGKFNDPMAADRYAQLLHEREAERTLGSQAAAAPTSAPPVVERAATAAPLAYGKIASDLMRDPAGVLSHAVTGLKAAAQGIPIVGTGTDEASAALTSLLPGHSYAADKAAYMAPVNALPQGERMGWEALGGLASGASMASALPAAFKLGAIPFGMLSGAAEGYGSGNDPQDRLWKGVIGSAVGGATGGLLSTLLGAGRFVAKRLSSDPFTSIGGGGAARTLRDAMKANPGHDLSSWQGPLATFPPFQPVARSVVNRGGVPAGEVMAAANQVGDKAVGDALSAVERAAPPKMISKEDWAKALKGEMVQLRSPQVTKGDLSEAGKKLYADAGVTQSGKPRGFAEEYPVEGALKDATENKIVKSVMKKQASDIVKKPIGNLDRLHAAVTTLGAKINKLSGKGPDTFERVRDLKSARDDLVEAITELNPKYGVAYNKYSEVAGNYRATTAGRKFDRPTSMSASEVAALPPRQRAAYASSAADRVNQIVATASSPKAAITSLNTAKGERLDAAFGPNAYTKLKGALEDAQKALDAQALITRGEKVVTGEPRMALGVPEVSSSTLGGATFRAVGSGASMAASAIRNKAGRWQAKDLADALTTMDPKRKRQVIDALTTRRNLMVLRGALLGMMPGADSIGEQR